MDKMDRCTVFFVCIVLCLLMVFSGCIGQQVGQSTTTTAMQTTTIRNSPDCVYATSTELKDDCYLEEAYLKFDEEICQSIINSEKKSRCYRAIAYRMNDVSICDNIAGEEDRGTCYAQVAKNLSTCDKIQDNTNKGICISKFAENLRDCEKITTGIWKDDCYSRIAFLKNDTTLCEMITDSVIKSMCTENLRII